MKIGGWTAFAVLAMLCSFSLGVGIVEVLYRLALAPAITASIPWLIVTLLILPSSFAIQLILKLFDLKGEGGLSQNEVRRLAILVDEKLRALYVAVAYYLTAGSITGFAFSMFSSNAWLLHYVLLGAGGFLGISICSMGFLLADFREVANFKTAVEKRQQLIANQRAALEQLSGDPK